MKTADTPAVIGLVILLLLIPECLRGQFKSFDGTLVYTEVHGEGDTTLLFIHGWNLDHRFWRHQVEAFSDRYRVVTLDLPGYGESGKQRDEWTIDAYGRDIRAVIDQLGLERVILVAHSMGGNIALEAIDEDPSGIIALVGVDNFKDVGSVPDSAMLAEMEMFYDFLKQDYPAHVRSASEGFMFSPDSPPGPKEEILDTYARARPEVAISVIRAVYSESANEMVLLENIRVPFFIISSTLIPLNQQGILTHYRGPFFRNYEVEEAGHFPMYERPDAFNESLQEVLKDLSELQD